MARLKILNWNVKNMDRLLGEDLTRNQARRRDAVVREVREIDPDIWCLVEGPGSPEDADAVAEGLFEGRYEAVKALDGRYAQKGNQWVWWMVKPGVRPRASLLPIDTWDDFTEKTFEVYRWGETKASTHSHHRHPQTLVLDWGGLRVELIGVHFKSKFINQGKTLWQNDPPAFMREAVEARMKLAREATNVRDYIDRKFDQTPNPAVFLMGDLNDGPGKEWFEDRFLFFDLISNVQGDVFFARRYLFHALFDFPQDLRWTVKFADFVTGETVPQPILLDHILFTQGLTDGSLSWRVPKNGGKVEHEIHELVNAALPKDSHTSDHRPVTLVVDVPDL
jgi:hypothetical protein